MADNNLNEVLGLTQDVGGFLDGKTRKAYPVTMRHFTEFVSSFAQVNINKFWTNFLFDEGATAFRKVLEMSFRDDIIEDLLDNINAGSFKNIVNVLMAINGIELSESKNEVEG